MKKLTLFLIGLLLLTLPALAYEADDATPPEVIERRELHEAELRRLRDEDETAALMAGGSATVRVTVNLPSGVTAAQDTEARVTLYTPAQLDASGRVIRKPESVSGKRASFPRGSSSATATFEDVEAGDYIFRVYTGDTSGCKVLNTYNLYYHGDGSRASSEYTAKPFSLSEGASVNKTITLPAAESSVSGVLNFSASLSKETEFRIMCSEQTRNSGYYYRYLTAPQGARSVPFSIGLPAGCYNLELSRSDSRNYYYLDYEGTLTTEYDKAYYYLVAAGKDVSGFSVNGDPLLGGQTENAGTVKVSVAVTLPETLTQEREFQVLAAYYDGDYLDYWDGSWATVSAGQTAFSVDLEVEKNTEYALGYRDITDCDSVYSLNSAKDTRYLAKDGGITTLYGNAKKFKFTGDTSVSVKEPACGRITGRVSRNGYNPGTRADAYAYAQFPDGERYCARVLMGTAESGAFVIYVPQTQSGETFQLSAMMARPNTNYPLEASASESVTRTFNGDADAGTINLSSNYVKASGTVSLPGGVKAIAGGQAIELEAQYEEGAYYVIPEGQNSASFSFYTYRRENYGESLRAYLESPLSGVFGEIGQNRSSNSSDSDATKKAWYQNRNIVFPASAEISGTVSFPSNVRDVGATLYFNASPSSNNGNDGFYVDAYAYSRISIFKGNTSAAYSFTVPVGKLSYLEARILNSTDGRVGDNSYYVDSNWKTVTEWSEGPTVTGNRSGVNFALEVFDSGVAPKIVSVRVHEEGENVMESLRENNYLYVVCEGPTGTRAMLVAVFYDENGHFLSSTTRDYVELNRAGRDNYFWFDEKQTASAAKMRVFLLDYSTLAPLDFFAVA